MLCPTVAPPGISSGPRPLPSRLASPGAAGVRGTGGVREALSEGFACRMRGKALGVYSSQNSRPRETFHEGSFLCEVPQISVGDELAAASLPFSGSKPRDLLHQMRVATSNNHFACRRPWAETTTCWLPGVNEHLVFLLEVQSIARGQRSGKPLARVGSVAFLYCTLTTGYP